MFFFSSHLVVVCGKLDKNCSSCIRVIVALILLQAEMIAVLRDSVKVVITSWNSLVAVRIRMCPSCMYLRLTVSAENKTKMLWSRSFAMKRSCSRQLIIENCLHGKSVLFTHAGFTAILKIEPRLLACPLIVRGDDSESSADHWVHL